MRSALAPLALLLLLAAAGCDSVTPAGPDRFAVEPGMLLLQGPSQVDSARIEIDGVVKSGVGVAMFDGARVVPGPAVVRAGRPVEVVVHTLGGLPKDYRAAETRIEPVAPSVRVAVQDSVFQGPVALVLTHHPRRFTVTYATPGPAELVVDGIRGGVEGAQPYTIRIPVDVRE